VIRRFFDFSRTSGLLNRLGLVGGIFAVASLLTAVSAGLARAQDPRNTTRADIDQWMAKYGNAKPDFKPGDVLTGKDIDRIRPFMMPGYVEQFRFPDMRMKIIPTRSHMPRRDYMDCTEKYQAQVRMAPDGSMANYFCGQPFADSALSTADPLSGYKAAWDF